MDIEGQPEAGDKLQQERKARGELRDAHLEAGRQRARSEQRDRVTGELDESRLQPEGELPPTDAAESSRRTQLAAQDAAMRAEARSRYEGTDESFERDWPGIRDELVAERTRQEGKRMRRRL